MVDHVIRRRVRQYERGARPADKLHHLFQVRAVVEDQKVLAFQAMVLSADHSGSPCCFPPAQCRNLRGGQRGAAAISCGQRRDVNGCSAVREKDQRPRAEELGIIRVSKQRQYVQTFGHEAGYPIIVARKLLPRHANFSGPGPGGYCATLKLAIRRDVPQATSISPSFSCPDNLIVISSTESWPFSTFMGASAILALGSYSAAALLETSKTHFPGSTICARRICLPFGTRVSPKTRS